MTKEQMLALARLLRSANDASMKYAVHTVATALERAAMLMPKDTQ